MWVVKISPSSKKEDEQFKPFKAKYRKKSEAERAVKALIRMAKGSTIAPSDEQTGKECVVFNHFPWGIAYPIFEKQC